MLPLLKKVFAFKCYILSTCLLLSVLLLGNVKFDDLSPGTSGLINCCWRFSHYESSIFESLWLENIEAWQHDICNKIAEPEHASLSEQIMFRILELKSGIEAYNQPDNNSISVAAVTQPADNLMSSLHYYQECSIGGGPAEYSRSGVQLIEPLWGMLRDPFDNTVCHNAFTNPKLDGVRSQSKEHLIPQGYAPYAYYTNRTGNIQSDKWMFGGLPPWYNGGNCLTMSLSPQSKPKNVFLDLGSAYFGSWRGSSNAASGEWFYNTYRHVGLHFSKFVAVEAETLEPKEVYAQIPDDLVGAYSLMNVPLTLDDSKLDIRKVIRSLATENDFFVIKLDIDSAALEDPFAFLLLEDNGVAGLIDEMMFEHHVDIAPMRGIWGEGLSRNLKDSYGLFKGLRQKGIRAHSWP